MNGITGKVLMRGGREKELERWKEKVGGGDDRHNIEIDKQTEIQTDQDRETDGWMERGTDMQTDRQSDRLPIDRWLDIWMNEWIGV